MVATVWTLCVAVLLVSAVSAGRRDGAKCPCKEDYLCDVIGYGFGKRVVGFVRSQDNWMQYNWTELTTLAMFTDLSPELMCYAHSKDVGVVLSANYPIKQLNDTDMRKAWIKQQMQRVNDSFADGINIDIEDSTDFSFDSSALLTQFVSEVYIAFKTISQYYQISFDVAWSPDCIDGRCYQALALSEFTDYLVIMAYDERSQIRGPCIASANSALSTTMNGVQEYLALGIQVNKLVLGLPWYGYDYPCLSLSSDDVCSIKEVPFRGVNCSDAAGRQRDYGEIRDLIRNSTATVQWDNELQSPYFHYKGSDAAEHQVWYDNVQSLSLKYSLARHMGLQGLAIWNVDSLDYSDSPRAKQQTAEMWQALSIFTRE